MLDKGYTVIGKDSKEMTKKIKSATSVSDILPKEETSASKKTADVASTNKLKETEKAEKSDNKAFAWSDKYTAIASSVALGIPFLFILVAGLYFAFRAGSRNAEDQPSQ